MTTLTLAAASTAPTTKADALLVGIVETPDGPRLAPGNKAVDRAFGGRLLATLRTLGATGKEGEVVRTAALGDLAADTVAAVGLGSTPDEPESVRRAAGAGVRALAGAGTIATTLAADGTDLTRLRAVAEGALMGAYAFDRYRTRANGARPPVRKVTVLVPDPKARDARACLRRADVVTRAVALARDLVNTSPADLHPADLAAAAERVATDSGLAIEVLDEKGLKRGKYGGILGVGQGSANPPRLVRLEYRHPRATQTVALVGKGITFDSGGLSIKPAQAMEWMKVDMAGAAAVIATMQAVAALKPQVHVLGFAPCAENMPSGTAIRPSDVLTTYAGRTVEVMNTDAEGRLILVDAIARALEDSPDVLVDVATLTGAALVALGSRTTGVMGNDDVLQAAICAAAERAGEAMWAMPLPAELRASLDSPVADISNTGDRNGGMLVAGLFLKEWVPDEVRWAHLDIAGPAYNLGDPWGYTPKGGTGAAVRTFVELVEAVAAGEV